VIELLSSIELKKIAKHRMSNKARAREKDKGQWGKVARKG
jgi:hypothetical protein